MIKFRMYFDKDKETEFLNEMSRQGYAMTGFCMGFYHFDECRPGEYVYQVDLSEGLFRVSNDYREFMKDMGVEIVCLWGLWVILRKRAEEGSFVMYTDVESSIEHYTKVKKIFKVLAAIEAACFFLELSSAANGVATAKVFTVLVGILFFVLVREVVRIKGILAELNARIGVDTENSGIRERKPSGFLAAGLLLNGVCMMLPDKGEIGQLNSLYDIVKDCGQVMALVMMVVGIASTFWRKKE